MASCPACRAENPHGARFCATCGTALVPLQAREVRKTITVLFADVTGSTALGEQLDPETLRSIMGRYLTMMKAVIEHHGGTVEKFIGDAVMAVFGIPTVHEDDALRAVRAAADIAAELARLNAELEQSRGIAIRFRTGINTGEVVAGDPATSQTLVTGDTVNVAARLEQAAPPGEILLGALTWSLVRDAVEVEPIEPIAAKGKAQPLVAYRLVSVRPGEAGRRRRLDAPLVGRERELSRLEQAFRQAVADGASGLFTLLGSAGVGKSRLVAEFVAGLAGEATVLRGHCLSYGEGITYWPIGEIVRSAAGIDEADTAEGARAKLRAVFGDERDGDVLAARVSSAIGLSSESAPQEEIFWAIRKLLEHLARERPLVVVVEDIHWAEPTLLDLLEHIVDWSRDAPFLVLCPARPEVLDARPGWGGGKLNATTVLLEALAADATARLIAALPGGPALPEPVIERIQTAAEGNPLYLEELLAMLVDDGLLVEAPDGTWQATADLAAVRVPASISALLAARLEQLDPAERAVAERASVVGRVFEAAAVNELSEASLRPAVGPSLLALVRKELVRPDRSELTAGDAFRFRHILIRDAAYAALPKADRAALHERFADWLERTAGQRLAELEEIVGHHLEQAYRYRTELGETGPALESLAERAAQRLTAAGLRAFDRSDARAAVDLLGLADTLAGIDPTTLLALAEARRRTGLLDSAVEAATRAATVAAETDQPDLLLRARMRVLDIRSFREPSALQDLRLVAGEALATAGPTGNPTVLAEAWRHVATVAGGNCQWEESLHAAENGIDAARAAGDHRAVAALANHVVLALLMGPSRCGDAISRCNALLLERGTLDVRAWTLSVLACLLAMSKDHSGWEALLAESDELYGQMGDEIHRAICRYFAGYTYHHLGDTARAERALRQAFDTMQGIGDSYILATTAGSLAQVLVDQGRFEEAERMIEIGSVADRADIDAHVLVTVASGRLCVARGDGNGAEDLARVAETLVEKTDETVARADVACLVADVLTLQGRFEEAADAARRGIALFESKGAGVLARRARRRLKEALLLQPSV